MPGNYTLFGALILATLPAVGGGIVRDLICSATRSVLCAVPWRC